MYRPSSREFARFLNACCYPAQPAVVAAPEPEAAVIMYEAMCQRLFRCPSAAPILDAMFDAVRTQLRMVHAVTPSYRRPGDIVWCWS